MSANFLQADVANVLADIDNLLTAYPELAEDADLRRDMLEGSTAAYDVLSRLVSIERDSDSMSKAIAARITDLQARRVRADKRKEAMRALMLRVMQAIGERKATLVEATVSVRPGKDSVEVMDVEALPDAYVRIERVPDKTALKAALANDNVPGAVLRAGDETVSVRAA
jgi:hypothetical protein